MPYVNRLTVMVRLFALGLGLAVYASSAAQAQVRSTPNSALADKPGGYSSEQVVMKLRPEASRRAKVARRLRRSGAAASVEEAVGAEVREVSHKWGALRIRPLYPNEFGNPELAAELGLDRIYVVDVPPGTDTPTMAADLQECAEDIEAAGASSIGSLAQLIPDDTWFSLQYGMHNTGQNGGTYDADIDAPEAWELHTGNPGTVTIAILDTGVDPHVDLATRLLPGVDTYSSRVCHGGSKDGYTCWDEEDCPGGYCDYRTTTSDLHGHGTHVTGIATATGNNAIGFAGVHWSASILPVRVTNSAGYSTVVAAASGLIWAANHGAEVCNLSLQYYQLSDANETIFEAAVDYAHGMGVIVIAAAGNTNMNPDPADPVAAPAKYANCVAVSASNRDDGFYTVSNHGPEVDVAAPGYEIYSTIGTSGYDEMHGTSQASPHVAGLAALIKSYAYYLTNDEIRTVLTSTADDLGDAGFDELFGYGRINAYAALSSITPSLMIESSIPPDGAIDARQPYNPDGTDPAGWDSIDITFDGATAGMTAADFTITVDPAGTTPSITAVTTDGDTVTLDFNMVIPDGAWTTIRHNDSNMTVRLGNLPGDVDADGTTDAADLQDLIDWLDGSGGPYDEWSTDINRSGSDSPEDILRLIDLLNGAHEYDAYLGVALPD